MRFIQADQSDQLGELKGRRGPPHLSGTEVGACSCARL
jgi:hypothetical protein